VPIVLKSGSLNLLEPSGPVKACNGIALTISSDYTENMERILTDVGDDGTGGFPLLSTVPPCSMFWVITISPKLFSPVKVIDQKTGAG
jgi:hypothetical protein